MSNAGDPEKKTFKSYEGLNSQIPLQIQNPFYKRREKKTRGQSRVNVHIDLKGLTRI